MEPRGPRLPRTGTLNGKPLPPVTSLASLIERIEQAEGPSRELSAEIALAVHDWLHEVEGNKPLNCRLRNPSGSPVYVGDISNHLHFTASLDAAMTLVPTEPYPELRPGKWWWMLEVREDETEAHIAYENHDAGIPEFGAKAATPALALCAAALKARSQ